MFRDEILQGFTESAGDITKVLIIVNAARRAAHRGRQLSSLTLRAASSTTTGMARTCSTC